MKVTLYLMTQKGYEVLKALIQNKFIELVSEVIIGRDKHIQKDYADDLISICKSNNIKFYERNSGFISESDYEIAISWRWLISPKPLSKLIVLHDSILPKYRGFAPLVNMLINKETEIGVSAIFASEEYDTGEIISQSSTQIEYPITIAEAIDLITKNYVEVIINIFTGFVNGFEISPIKQNEELATYSLWLNEDDYLINWKKDANEILRLINAVSFPYKGASTFINGKQKVRIIEAELEPDVKIENRSEGKVIFVRNQFPIVVCGSGLIRLKKVYDEETGSEIIPLKNFRVKFSSQLC